MWFISDLHLLRENPFCRFFPLCSDQQMLSSVQPFQSRLMGLNFEIRFSLSIKEALSVRCRQGKEFDLCYRSIWKLCYPSVTRLRLSFQQVQSLWKKNWHFIRLLEKALPAIPVDQNPISSHSPVQWSARQAGRTEPIKRRTPELIEHSHDFIEGKTRVWWLSSHECAGF